VNNVCVGGVLHAYPECIVQDLAHTAKVPEPALTCSSEVATIQEAIALALSLQALGFDHPGGAIRLTISE
jgi:hypothetical protein